MDVVAACRAFVHVSERGSFTLGAAAARIPQPVASRRIAALEHHLGGRLLDRSGRRVALTSFGRAMLPTAERLVRLVDAMEHDAEAARRGPLRLAVPEGCAVRDLAELVARAAATGVNLEPQPAPPPARAELIRLGQVHAALTAVPASEADWSAPLGLAGGETGDGGSLFLETLRPSRAQHRGRRAHVWIQREDDVPHVADRLRRLGDRVGLQPAQIAVTPSLVNAAGAVLSSADLLLCSPRQADELRLPWRPVGEINLDRGHTLTGPESHLHELSRLRPAVGRCLGATSVPAGAT